MKRIVSILIIQLVGLILSMMLVEAQPRIPQHDIPDNISSNIRVHIENLYSKDPLQRALAARSLGSMGIQAIPAVPFLISILDDNVELEEYLIDSSTGKRVTPPRMGAKSSPSIEAIKALGKIKDKGAVKPLIEKLKDKGGVVRGKAAFALGEIKDLNAVEPLIDLLVRDKDWTVQMYSAYALGEIGDMKAVDSLLSTLEKNLEFTFFQEKLVTALVKITGNNYGKDVRRWRSWWNTYKIKSIAPSKTNK